jgi:hypothetical protein
MRNFLIKLLGGYTRQYSYNKEWFYAGYLGALLHEYGEVTFKQPNAMITEIWIKGKKITYTSSSTLGGVYFAFKILKPKFKGRYRITKKGNYFSYPRKFNL